MLINRVGKDLIQPQIGLKQGCVLSLYFFILCVEVFSNLLIQVESKNLFQRLRFNKELSINHPPFGDDSLLFTIAAIKDCSNLKKTYSITMLLN